MASYFHKGILLIVTPQNLYSLLLSISSPLTSFPFSSSSSSIFPPSSSSSPSVSLPLSLSLCLSPTPQVLPETVIGVWKGGDDWPSEMFNITKAGLKTILSACWYLDLISYGQDWQNVSRRIVLVLELSCNPASPWQ